MNDSSETRGLPIAGWVAPGELAELAAGEPWVPLEREDFDGGATPITDHTAATAALESMRLRAEAAERECETLRISLSGWLCANSPAGWIDELRQRAAMASSPDGGKG